MEQVINKDIVNVVVNSTVDNASVNVNECEKCLKLETELLNKKDFIEKETYDKLFRSYITLEKHCISLEVDSQLNQELFQRDNSVSNQSAPSFDHYFELNKLKAQSQQKDTIISKFKKRIKSLSGTKNTDKTYKQLCDAIKPTRVRSKEQCDALINQVNQKYVEISDLNVRLQEKDLVIIALKNDLRKLKGKYIVDDVVTSHTIAPEMLKVDVEQLAPKLLNNRTAHSDYLRHTQKQVVILREKNSKRKFWKPTGKKVFTNIGYIWRPTGRIFTIVRNVYSLTRITNTTEVPFRNPIALETDIPKHVVTMVYSRKPRKSKTTNPVGKSKVIKLVSVNKKEPSKSWGSNVPASSLDECRLSKLFSSDDLLTGSQGNNLYTLFLGDMMASSPICLLSKASKTKSWLWHGRLSHLNFGALNHLARHGLVRGLLKLKFEKDYLCSACAMGKSKKKPYKPKSENTNQEKLYLLRVVNVNGKKYILVIVHDYSRFTWVGISHETSVARSPQQNDVIKRRNRTLIEAARTISSELALHEITPTTISSGLVPNLPPSTPFVPPSRTGWDILFQPLFDELLTPSPSVDHPAPEVIAPIDEVVAPEPAASTGSPSSTTVDQDAASVTFLNLRSFYDSYYISLFIFVGYAFTFILIN
nr:retrovirus-related Pol polyprotein from transposon TNT 1-94 [Tanacetum cinerariifolium]